MISNGVSHGFLGVVGDISEMERSVDVHSETSLTLFSSLAFLVPAVTAWRMKRFWHCSLFASLTIVCASYHYCNDNTQQLGAQQRCSPALSSLLTHIFFVWVYFCSLQMAFLVMGPEDPQLQWLQTQSVPGSPSCATPTHAPFDTIITARVVPLVVLSVFYMFQGSWDTEETHWQSLLLNEILLLGCCTVFWLHHTRQCRAADVLIRFKFWHRLLHQGFIPAMMLFWIFCIMGFTDFQTLHSMWHSVVAVFAMSLLRTVLLGETSSSAAKVFDVSPHNPNVAHVLLGSVALILLPSSVIGASFDWCSHGQKPWPTISSATLCQPGGYFVAIVSVPAFAGVSTVFWLIDSTATLKGSWQQTFTSKSWEFQERGEWGECHSSSSCTQQQALGRRFGCLLGSVGALFGLVAALLMKGSAVINVINLFCSIMSLGLITIAMVLTVLTSSPASQVARFRRGLTLLVTAPVLVVHIVLMLANQCLPSHYQVPQTIYAVTEYLVVLLLAIWPLTWVSEVQDTWQRNASGSFAWPTTTWRFA